MGRDTLVEKNIRLVYYFYEKLRKDKFVTMHKDDIVSEGFIGLIKAASSFDEARGVKFATYASRCISNQMLMYIRKRKKWQEPISLFTPITTDNEQHDLLLMDVIEDAASSIDRIIDKIDFDAAFLKFYTRLKQRDKEIIDLRKEGYTQQEIANILDLSQSYISRLVCRMRRTFKVETASEYT